MNFLRFCIVILMFDCKLCYRHLTYVDFSVLDNLFNFFDKALLSILANNQSEICSDRNTLFVDHVTTILKLVLDRADELFSKQVAQGDMGGRQGSITHLSPFSLDFGTLIMHIVQYLIYLTAIPSQNQTAIKAKVRLCNVLQVLLQKKSLVGIKNDVAFQNYMVEILLEWNSEFHTVGSNVFIGCILH